MASVITDSLILETLLNASDLPENKCAQHAEHLLKLQKLCPDKDLEWILQHPAEVFPVIPEYHTDTVSAILDTIMRIPDLLKMGTTIQAWKMQIADHVLSVTVPEGWENNKAVSEIKECTDEEIIKLINDSPDLAAQSKTSYMSRIRTLQSLFPEKTLQWMCMNPDIVSTKIKESYSEEGSRKAYFVAIIAMMKLNPEIVQLSGEVKWKQIMSGVNKIIGSRENQASARQQAGYVAWEDILATRESMPRSSVEYLFLSCYTMIPPVRADFSNLRIFRYKPDEHERSKNPNYLQIADNKYTLILKEYKTAKTMGEYVNELPEDLCTVLRNYIKDDQAYLFTGRGGEQFQSTQTYINWSNRLLQRVFKKPLTPTMLRHSYITHLDTVGISTHQQYNNAALLMHNPQQFKKYVLHDV